MQKQDICPTVLEELYATKKMSCKEIAMLFQKLNGLGVNCHRDKRNKVYIGARYAVLFLKFLAPNPVVCYNYKFRAIKEG